MHKQQWTLMVVLVLLSSALVVLLPATPVSGEESNDVTAWMKGTVDSSANVASGISEVVDQDGVVHACYYDGNSDNLIYISNLGGEWSREVVDSHIREGSQEIYTSIAVRGSGSEQKVAIAYYDGKAQDMVLAQKQGDGGWDHEEIESSGDVGKYNSISFDPSGNLGIVYFDSQEKLKFAYGSGNDFIIEEVDGMNPGGTSISFFSNGTPAITYLERFVYHLKLASKNNGTWAKSTIDDNPVSGVVSGCIDGRDQMHMAYVKDTHLQYLSTVGGTWQTPVVVDPTSVIGQSISLKVDRWGSVHISYCDANEGVLRYAHGEGSEFQVQTLSEGNDSGIRNAIGVNDFSKKFILYCEGDGTLQLLTDEQASWSHTSIATGLISRPVQGDLAIDAQGVRHLVYFDPVIDGLVYEEDSTGSWSRTIIDVGGVGQNPCLTVDGQGRCCISYYDQGNSQLKFATNLGGSWVNGTIDPSTNVGKYSVISIDTNSTIYIIYTSDELHNLKFASRQSGDWVTNVLDTSGLVNPDPGLAIFTTPNGDIHISYLRDNRTYYSMNSNGLWALPTLVAADRDSRECTSIAVDDQGKVFISFYVSDPAENSGLYLASSISGGWNYEAVVLGEGGLGEENALLLEQGKPHLAYVNDQGHLCYVALSDGIWMQSTLDSNEMTGGISSAMDRTGRPHFLSFNGNADTLQLLEQKGVPTAPQNLTAIVGEGYVDLQWNEPDYGAPCTAWIVYRAIGEGDLVQIATLEASEMVTPRFYNDTGLESDIEVSYAVAGINAEGQSGLSNMVIVNPDVPDQEDGSDMTWVWAGIALVIVAVAAIWLFLRTRGGR